jgi:hypothetical protein
VFFDYVQQDAKETKKYQVYCTVFTRQDQPDYSLVFDLRAAICLGIKQAGKRIFV